MIRKIMFLSKLASIKVQMILLVGLPNLESDWWATLADNVKILFR